MFSRLLSILFILTLSIPAWAGPTADQRLHEIRITGFLLCSNLLVHFNNHDAAATFDPEAKEAYRQNLTHLQKMLEDTPENMEIANSLQRIQSAIEQLEQQPKDAHEQYSRWINPILREHGTFEKIVASAYEKAPATDPATANLNQQSLDISRMLLLYETQAFIGLGIFSIDFHEDVFQEIDQRIDARHATLLDQLPASKDELEKIRTDYNFIRPRLLHPDQKLVPRSAAIYLGRSVTRLNSLTDTRIIAAQQ
ncbi:hypothetical protein SAMN05216201_11020 [Pseudomonas linyingensis]|uniref:Uncharacterized protein n=1 Tax=Pseudomonas linyingensis TaxID=915471 RepID=A0A1H6ZDK0_9PSED|nr:hypothetical protein [Pseudomonas linyingensis]SEJ51481.1 hypothetical protein SAMN05216201_11020 [Pseudomonas linyingensis]